MNYIVNLNYNIKCHSCLNCFLKQQIIILICIYILFQLYLNKLAVLTFSKYAILIVGVQKYRNP